MRTPLVRVRLLGLLAFALAAASCVGSGVALDAHRENLGGSLVWVGIALASFSAYALFWGDD